MTDDPFGVAAEHVAFLLRRGDQPIDHFVATGETPPRAKPTWHDVLWSVARLSGDFDSSGSSQVWSIHPPLKRAA